jgi:proteasome accessory factor B
LWQHAGLASSASSGLLKLRAGGIDVDPHATLGIEPVVNAEPALEAMFAAIHERRAVRFEYRTPRDDAPARRHLQPWGAVSWRGRWYVVGHDTDRAATRCFRLSRVVGGVTQVGPADAFTPPAGVNLLDHVATAAGAPEHHGKATIQVRTGAGAGLRRWAREIETGDDGWDVLTLEYSDPESLASRLAGYGAAVIAVAPPEVRAAVIRRLTTIAADDELPAVPAERSEVTS